jgi:hypothetical protein
VNKKIGHPLKFTSSKITSKRLAIYLWLLFAAGLLVQAMTPGLKIENRAFVMPPTVNVQGENIRPDALVSRERWMQAASGILTVGSALALGFCYRRTLLAAVKG